jgi:hypothetical protein
MLSCAIWYGRVVDQDVQPAELLDGLRDQVGAVLLVAQVAGDRDAPAAGLGDQPHRLVGVALLLRQVRDHDVRALAGEGERHGPPDAESPPVTSARRPSSRPRPR